GRPSYPCFASQHTRWQCPPWPFAERSSWSYRLPQEHLPSPIRRGCREPLRRARLVSAPSSSLLHPLLPFLKPLTRELQRPTVLRHGPDHLVRRSRRTSASISSVTWHAPVTTVWASPKCGKKKKRDLPEGSLARVSAPSARGIGRRHSDVL